MDKSIDQLVQAIREASPILWEAAREKVRANVIVDAVGITFFLAVIVIIALRIIPYLHNCRDCAEDYDTMEWTFGIWAAHLSGAFVTLILLYIVCDVVYLLWSPQYFAVKALAELVNK